ncbi:MAG: DUF4350 domain-containing protein [Candidatus Acidiferrales bacterium]
MPAALDSADRKMLLAAGAALLLLMAAIAFESPTGESQGEAIPSTYYSSPGGALAAYLLLQQLHYSVERWERSPLELPQDSTGSILILADPSDSPSAAEKRALLGFVEAGGQVLFTGRQVEEFFDDAHIADYGGGMGSETYAADLPSALTRGAPNVTLRPEAVWGEARPTETPLYSDDDADVIVCWRVGAGRILWWAGPTPLTNAGITEAGNMNLFLDAMNVSGADSSSAAPAQIYWDEYFHGERSSLWSYMQGTPVAWGVLQLGLLGVGVLFTFSRRSGPTAIPASVSRLSPLEFVDTLGGLYERAKAEPAVVGIVYQRFRTLLTRQLRLPLTTDDATLENAIRTRLGKQLAGLPEALHRVAAATRAEKVSPAEALALIKELEHYEQQLGLKKPGPQEKS